MLLKIIKCGIFLAYFQTFTHYPTDLTHISIIFCMRFFKLSLVGVA